MGGNWCVHHVGLMLFVTLNTFVPFGFINTNASKLTPIHIFICLGIKIIQFSPFRMKPNKVTCQELVETVKQLKLLPWGNNCLSGDKLAFYSFGAHISTVLPNHISLSHVCYVTI